MRKSIVGIIGDIHAPVTRKGYLKFCKETFKKYGCNKIVFIGDIVDWTSVSFHAHNPECPGPMDEYILAFKEVQKWYRAFPNATVTIGNHDARPKRLAESVNIPAKMLRDYNEQWKTPGWKWVYHTIIDNVYYHHGHGKCGGINPAFNTAKELGMSVVLGHNHSRGGIKWHVSPLRRWFGLDVGCGVDDSAYAFAYAKEQTRRSVLSCGVVIGGREAFFVPMPCGKGERYWDGNFKTKKDL